MIAEETYIYKYVTRCMNCNHIEHHGVLKRETVINFAKKLPCIMCGHNNQQIACFYLIEYEGYAIIINLTHNALLMGPLPILWYNAGTCLVIPEGFLKEIFEEERKDKGWTHKICLDQAYELESDEQSRLLCDPTYNRNCRSILDMFTVI